ncbi:FAD-dependent monooxygenase [uncultured Algibacter sp.]|uniref:FAD-dependent monooxygenase n=1 Tax=uncultured Algibacter sp. TaxID=298659 RepID=UPI002611732A|nr:FAD-dependent monooxygenase [uncultured Algibacter sp.]
MDKTINIIGAGIGGLTTAIALEQKGFKTRIFEQSEKIKPVGAGIILANNAMQVYTKLGLNKIIESHGNAISSLNITKPSLKPLSKADLSFFEKKHNTKNIAIHRGELQQLLINQLMSSEILLNHKLEDIVQDNDDYILKFNNNKTYNTPIVLGADGINSVVRDCLFPKSEIRHANQICWRGITNYTLPKEFKNELNEAWGKDERFGFVQISDSTVYWYALKSFKKNKNELTHTNIGNYFNDYHSCIKDLISATPKEKLNTAEISDLKPTTTWYRNNVCLIGDAAHATTPNMGQGACQAIEDAFVFSECLETYETDEAFEKFQNIRLPKAHHVVKTSWSIGKMAHISNPILIGLRNKILQLTPTSISKKQYNKLFQLSSI